MRTWGNQAVFLFSVLIDHLYCKVLSELRKKIRILKMIKIRKQDSTQRNAHILHWAVFCTQSWLHWLWLRWATLWLYKMLLALQRHKGKGEIGEKCRIPFFNPPSNDWLSYRVTTKEQCVFTNRTLKLVFKFCGKNKNLTPVQPVKLCLSYWHWYLQLSKLLPDRFAAVPGTDELSFSRIFIPTTTTPCTESGISGGHSMKCWKDCRDVSRPVGFGLLKTQLEP